VSITNIYTRRNSRRQEVMYIPVIQIYLKQHTYRILENEALKSGLTIGKFISQILDSYVEYLEKGRRSNGKEEI